MALTATASDKVVNEVKASLHLSDPFESVSSVDRPNLQISSQLKSSSYQENVKHIADMLLKPPQSHGSSIASPPSLKSAIVYVQTQDQCKELTKSLSQCLDGYGIVKAYHGGMSLQERDTTHKEFLTGQAKVVTATIAFGMGIDKPDVRQIIHYGNSFILYF